ncbi:MAG: rhomboid family intramembrane serine protease [Bacteroidota bacterium]
MAFGLSPKKTKTLKLDYLTPEHFLVIAVESVRSLNWEIKFISNTRIIAYTELSDKYTNEEIKLVIKEKSASITSESTGNQLVDYGKNLENIQNFITTFNELKISLYPEELELKFEELFIENNLTENDKLNLQAKPLKKKIKDILSIFTPTHGYVITPILIDINILVFILMIFNGVNVLFPNKEDLLSWGANLRLVTLDGQLWRLITCCFLHIGLSHLLFNMIALLFIGIVLEPQLGKTRFAAAYLITGITASVNSICWHDMTISVGASGAIFGMYGIFLALLTTNLIVKSSRKTLLISIGVFVGYSLINGLKNKGVDNAAHIGGLLAGLVMGYAYYPSLKTYKDFNINLTTVSLLVISILFIDIMICSKLQDIDAVKSENDIYQTKEQKLDRFLHKNKYTKVNNSQIYNEKMERFKNIEALALEGNISDKYNSKEANLREIKTRKLYYWKENLEIVKDISNLNLSSELRLKNNELIKYCELRIESMELLYKSIDESTDKYNIQLDELEKKIEKLNDKIKSDN